MIKLIVGTKAMIDMINDSVKTSKGNVVVVEKGMKLTYDISSSARLIDLDEYKISGGEMLYGFIAGLMASNYDITDLYIDGILKVLDHDLNRLGVVLDEIAAIAGGNGGGKPDFAMAGIRDTSKIDDALNAVPEIVKAEMNQ